MSDWKARRFWDSTGVVAQDDAWAVTLDTRILKTPAKRTLRVPTRSLAEEIAAEWSAQQGDIDPLSMPMTRAANAALDKVAPQFHEVAELVAAYGDTDLCCYRAEAPQPLLDRQAEAWDPLLDWLEEFTGVRLACTAGVVPIAQSADGTAELRRRVRAVDAFELTALHELVALSGSLVIGLAAFNKVFPTEELWRRSRIDETWQESQWGIDDEAAAVASRKRGEFLQAARFLDLSRTTA